MLDLTILRQALAMSGMTPWAMHHRDGAAQLLAATPFIGADEAAAGRIQSAARLDGTRVVFMHGDTAVFMIRGPLMQRFNGSYISFEEIRENLGLAIDSPDVERIMLAVQSPGGQAQGCDECAEAISEAARRKPLAAHVEGMSASAAYWLSAAASRITATRTSMVGSVGAVIGYLDLVGILERMGARKVEIVSTQSPNKRHPAGSDEEREELQPIIDEIADIFIDDVARLRGVSRKTVLEKFGKGSVFTAAEALSRGMIDAVGTFSEALAELADRQMIEPGPAPAAARAIHKETKMDWSKIDAAGLQANRPDLVKTLEDTAFAIASDSIEKASCDGAKAERARIKALQDAALPGYEKELAAAIDSGARPEAFAIEVLRAEKAKGADYLKNREKAEAEGAPADTPPTASALPAAPQPATDHASAEAVSNAEWDKLGAKQSEHLSKDVFVANRMYDLGFPKHTRPAA